jgi:hypothetical protein
MSYVWGFLRFWYDFLVGDAWDIAAGVVAMLVALWVLATLEPAARTVLGPLLALGVVLLTRGSVRREAHRR